MALEFTTRITDLDFTAVVGLNDELVMVSKADLEYSADGTDRKITPRNLIENTSIRPSNNLTVSQTVAEWVGEFRDAIQDLENSTGQASTGSPGTIATATDSQARNKVSNAVALTPSNLNNLIADDLVHGLLRAATGSDAEDHTIIDAAITPAVLFSTILGASVFGANSNVFKFPVKNSDTDELVFLTIQYGQQTGNGVFTNVRPETNPNHTHQFVDVGVTFPEPFENACLMVIPMGFDVDPMNYEEGTDYFFRPKSFGLETATIRGTRINGLNEDGEQIGVKYIAIGY